MKKAGDFLDERTGFRKVMRWGLDEEVPGGASFAYVFGSALSVILMVQIATGLLLMVTYTPSVTGAWSSVFYIQHKVTMGWFVRGLHHHGANAMVIVLGLHMLQVVAYGAYKRPREVTWWLGLALLGVVQGLALTGYLLPWDQKGYWATKVATNIAGSIPLIGAEIQALVVGGTEYGQSTLSRFFALHVGVLPVALLGILTLHVALFRKHGSTPPDTADPKRRDTFYPAQFAKDVIFAVVVLGLIAVITSTTGGAELDAPASAASDYPPRPEWYFLFLFQLLKYLPGAWELLGTVFLPGLICGFLLILPFLDRGPSRKMRDRLPWVAAIAAGTVTIVALTGMAMSEDAADADFQLAREDANRRSRRAVELAMAGVPPGGPIEMLDNDPMTRGRDVYEHYCTSCHVLNGEGERKAPDHTGFGSRKWTILLMQNPADAHFFGEAGLSEEMPAQGDRGEETLEEIAEFLFSLGREAQDPDDVDPEKVEKGRAAFDRICTSCHVLDGDGDFDGFGGPDLSRYASRTWIFRQVMHPEATSQYGELNDMPSFADQLTERDVRMVGAYLRYQRFENPDFEIEPAED